jgi:hypothetical protein
MTNSEWARVSACSRVSGHGVQGSFSFRRTGKGAFTTR